MQQCCQVIVIAGFSVKFGAVEAISCPSSMMMGSFLLFFFHWKIGERTPKKKTKQKERKETAPQRTFQSGGMTESASQLLSLGVRGSWTGGCWRICTSQLGGSTSVESLGGRRSKTGWCLRISTFHSGGGRAGCGRWWNSSTCQRRRRRRRRRRYRVTSLANGNGTVPGGGGVRSLRRCASPGRCGWAGRRSPAVSAAARDARRSARSSSPSRRPRARGGTSSCGAARPRRSSGASTCKNGRTQRRNSVSQSGNGLPSAKMTSSWRQAASSTVFVPEYESEHRKMFSFTWLATVPWPSLPTLTIALWVTVLNRRPCSTIDQRKGKETEERLGGPGAVLGLGGRARLLGLAVVDAERHLGRFAALVGRQEGLRLAPVVVVRNGTLRQQRARPVLHLRTTNPHPCNGNERAPLSSPKQGCRVNWQWTWKEIALGRFLRSWLASA